MALSALILSFILAPAASAQPQPFERAYPEALAQAASYYANGNAVLDPEGLKPFVNRPEHKEKLDAFYYLLGKAAYVQMGRSPADEPEVYEELIRYVAGQLSAEPETCVRVYRGRVRSSADAAMSEEEASLRADIMGELLASQRLAPAVAARVGGSLRAAGQALLAQSAAAGRAPAAAHPAPAVPVEAPAPSASSPSPEPAARPGLKTQPAPAPAAAQAPPAPAPTGWGDYLDWEHAKLLAQQVWDAAVGFTKYCYRYVLRALERIGVFIKGWRAHVGADDVGSAYEFNNLVRKHPALFKRKLREISARTKPLPIGSIVVWDQDCGFSKEHGHIEIVVDAKDPPMACSDGCARIRPARWKKALETPGCLRVYILARPKAPVGH